MLSSQVTESSETNSEVNQMKILIPKICKCEVSANGLPPTGQLGTYRDGDDQPDDNTGHDGYCNLAVVIVGE